VLDPSIPPESTHGPVLSARSGSPHSRLASRWREPARGRIPSQVPVRAGFLNLFVLMNGERRRCARTAPSSRGWAQPAAGGGAACWRRIPRLEPGRLLRPLAQDFMCPRCYVGAGGDRLPCPDRTVHALSDPASGFAARPASPSSRPATCGCGVGGTGAGGPPGDPERVVTRWRARPTRKWRPPSAAPGRRGAGDGGSGATLGALDPTCAPPPTPPAGGSPPDRGPHEKSSAPSRSATRPAPIGCDAPGTRSFRADRCRSGWGWWDPWPATAWPHQSGGGRAWIPGQGHQLVAL